MPEAKVDIALNGDNTIIAAAAGFRYQLLQIFLVPAADVTIKFKSGANDMTGPMPIIGNVPFILNMQQLGWITFNSGEALIINLSGAIAVGGRLVFDKSD